MTMQGSFFDEDVKLPLVLGRIKETNEFYDEAAERALRALSFKRDRLAVMITKTGLMVATDVSKIEPKFHVLTINHRTDPDHLVSTMKECAFALGFDEGVRRGRVRACRS